MSSSPSIITPRVDPWLVGGLSILVLGAFIILSSAIPPQLALGNFIALTVILNGTHFMASYALLYSSTEHIKRYRVAAVYLPIALMAAGASALWLAMEPRGNGSGILTLMVITALYLALHYTGQVWGMMASYAYLNKISFTLFERRVLRGCLRTMAGWQMVWALTASPAYIPHALIDSVPVITRITDIIGALSFVIGGVTLISVRRKNNKPLPASLLLPFFSLYVWYIFLSVYPQSIFWVQIFHALQYLSFPLRVEMNRASARGDQLLRESQIRYLLKYCVALTAASLFVFVGIDKMLNYPNGGFENYFLVFICLINIHHYFIDGCIWHISNPEVKADLFAHVGPRAA